MQSTPVSPAPPERTRRADRYRQETPQENPAAQSSYAPYAQPLTRRAPQQQTPIQAAQGTVYPPPQPSPAQPSAVPTPRALARIHGELEQPSVGERHRRASSAPMQGRISAQAMPAAYRQTPAPAQPGQGQTAPRPTAAPASPQAAPQRRADASYAPPRPVAPGPSAPSLARRAPMQAVPGDAPIQRSSYQHARMLESPMPATQPRRREKPLPAWMLWGMAVMLIVILGMAVCGIWMNNSINQQRKDRQTAWQKVVNAHPIQYQALIERYAAEYNLQPAFVASIILNESSFNTMAESRVGARGLMQLMPDTAQWIAHKLRMDSAYQVDMLWDAETNIRFGCWYLNYLSNMFYGDAVTVSSAYHAGQGEITSWLRSSTYAPNGRTLDLNCMPDGPTKIYAGRVTRDYGIYDALYFGTYNSISTGPVTSPFQH